MPTTMAPPGTNNNTPIMDAIPRGPSTSAALADRLAGGS
jgi:hypothetical protein